MLVCNFLINSNMDCRPYYYDIDTLQIALLSNPARVRVLVDDGSATFIGWSSI